jgi:hypothetical protein
MELPEGVVVLHDQFEADADAVMVVLCKYLFVFRYNVYLKVA